jgi:hypothetical protein
VEFLAITGGTSATASATVPPTRDGSTGNMSSSRFARQLKPMPVTMLPSSEDQEPAISNKVPSGQSQKSSRTRPKPTIARRPVTRSRNRVTDYPTGTLVESPPARHEASSIPRLSQGTNHVKTYYNNANEVFKRLNMNEAQLEVDFVSAFISGITDGKIKNMLIAELQKLHPSRNRKDGRIEVLCDWDDIPEGLRKAGLLSPAKESSRRKHRILGDLSDLGF